MKERPILFSGGMVCAILEGRKTQTRRPLKFSRHTYIGDAGASWVKSIHRDGGGNWIAWSTDRPGLAEYTLKQYPNGEGFPCPYGKPGDRLWVRETWAEVLDEEWDYEHPQNNMFHYEYRADLAPGCTDYPGGWPAVEARGNNDAPIWRPSIFMPRKASRITLEITGVRVERLQDISEDDARAEGAPGIASSVPYPKQYRHSFEVLWNLINTKRGFGWDVNPWVWVIQFKVCADK